MARLYRRHKDGPWYYDFETPEGKRVQRSARTTDKAVAKERARQAELAATPNARGRKQRLSEALDHMIKTLHGKADGTVEMYEQKARRVGWTKPDPLVSEVSHDWIADYIQLRLEKASGHTIQKELIAIRRALKLCVKRGILVTLPTFPEFSAKYQPRETWLTPEQFSAVCAELEPKRQMWASLAALAGANHSEVEGIDWTDVDLAAGRVRIRGKKRATRDRTVPIAPALRHVLELVPVGRRRGRVAEPWSNVRRDLHAAVNRANAKAVWDLPAGEPQPPAIPLVSPNDLRRTFASWLVQQKVPLLTVAHLMGHSSTRMLEKVYGRLADRNYEEAIAVLPRLGVTHGVTESIPSVTTPDHTWHTGGHCEPSGGDPQSPSRNGRESASYVECPGTELNRRHADFQSACEPGAARYHCGSSGPVSCDPDGVTESDS
jgi:integrase